MAYTQLAQKWSKTIKNRPVLLCWRGAKAGLPDWPFHSQFRKIRPFFNCAGHEKTCLAILYHWAIFWPFFGLSLWNKVSLNILSFCIFRTVFIPLIVTVTPWQFDLFFFEVCSIDLALAVIRFCTDVSVSDNLLVTIGICCARTVSENCCTRLRE